MIAYFNSDEAAKITKRIRDYEKKLQQDIDPKKRENWKKSLFTTDDAIKFTKRIAGYEQLLNEINEEQIPKSDWEEQKKTYYPDEPVIQLGEMDEKTLNPYPDPHGYRKSPSNFEFSEKTSERYNRAGANKFRGQGNKWSDSDSGEQEKEDKKRS